MKTERNIFVAFILNFLFSIFEFFGGLYTGSVAIVSDAIHDLGDALSIGLSFFLEKKSKKQPDDNFTYGYARYSVLGGIITNLVLLFGSVAVIYNAIEKIISPTQIKYDGMIAFAVVGVCVNFLAAFFTREGDSINQKAVNLHMLEDVLGWVVVLIGAIVMKYTNFSYIDPVMSVCVSVFILTNAVRNVKQAMDVFLEKIPESVNVNEIKEHISEIEGVKDVHHVHIWTMDGERVYATMHVVAEGDSHIIKEDIRHELFEHGISHVTIEIESENEHCHERLCKVEAVKSLSHHHHHH